jgi:N-acetylglucosaminyldiphosphoundecaprenol N-acetyl-beta-D-mannosaminyltransferase
MEIKTETLLLMNYPIYTGSIEDIFISNDSKIINTINPHSYCVGKKDQLFRNALKQSDILLPDGVGIIIAALILKLKRIKQNSGPHLHTALLEKLNNEGKSCFYLGSSEETLKLIESRLKKEFPLIHAGFYSPPFKETFTEEDNQKMIMAINSFKPDILFVGMTAPKQEKWVFSNHHMLNAGIICCIGAVFDFYAGKIKMPNRIFFKLGLVWLIRLFQEPKRMWKRNFISTPQFLIDVFLFRIGLKHR